MDVCESSVTALEAFIETQAPRHSTKGAPLDPADGYQHPMDAEVELLHNPRLRMGAVARGDSDIASNPDSSPWSSATTNRRSSPTGRGTATSLFTSSRTFPLSAGPLAAAGFAVGGKVAWEPGASTAFRMEALYPFLLSLLSTETGDSLEYSPTGIAVPELPAW